jgi:hypothetical protein
VVEGLACQQRVARRRGERIVVDPIRPRLEALLDLSGLRGEVVGQAEEGEQVRAEEAVEAGDPAV